MEACNNIGPRRNAIYFQLYNWKGKTVSMRQILEVIYFYTDRLLPLLFCGICFCNTLPKRVSSG
jgi:hypothetical protein